MVVCGYMILHGTVTRGGSRGGMQTPPLLPLLARGLRETTQSAASLGCLTYARS